MIKKILLIVAVVTLFASVAVMLLAKDSNEGKIGNINNYSKNYIYNRQEKLKKEKEEKEKVVAKLKGVACWEEVTLWDMFMLIILIFFMKI